MTAHVQELEDVISNVSPETLTAFFQRASNRFRPNRRDCLAELKDGQDLLENLEELGQIEFPDGQVLMVLVGKIIGDITRRRSRSAQYAVAKRVIKQNFNDAAIFVFYDDEARFRFSYISAFYSGKKREFSTFKRYTYFVDPERPNKTFRLQIGRATAFESTRTLLKTFSIDEVSKEFYDQFKPIFDKIAQSITGRAKPEDKENLALLFVIRIIFLGFVQKKGWLGEDEEFLQHFWEDYLDKRTLQCNEFYTDWLEPLFFEALNNPPGYQVRGGNTPFGESIKLAIQMSPYLNGELFKKKWLVDDQGMLIPDKQIKDFFDFLFQYNFTIEENTRYDEELGLNPEFLGIIFERLVNKANGAVYTPRTEVDFMCRLSLVKWLQNNLSFGKDSTRDLYHLIFRDAGVDPEFDVDQKQGDFSENEIRDLVDKLRSVTVCDPAAGSGAFEVGMMQVLNEILENLETRPNCPGDEHYCYTPGDEAADAEHSFRRKKQIIANSLYGVEVKPWAVWINHLRLWLSLFIDMPDSYRNSQNPLLPNLGFKVRCGDSLVQRVAGKLFPIEGHATLPKGVRLKVTALKKRKVQFFYNDETITTEQLEYEERRLFETIIDQELASVKDRLNGVKTQGAFKFVADGSGEQAKLDASIKQKLQAQKKELEGERGALQRAGKRPLVWSIEFAEIFHDRGGFDIIIGNPPYIDGNKIKDPLESQTGLTGKQYKKLLADVMAMDYRPCASNEIKVDGKSNLFVYFYLHSLKLLKPTGMHCFICQNSWLDIKYGVWMQELILRRIPMHFVFDNHSKRSFSSADVNTVITLFEAARTEELSREGRHVKFVAFQAPFESVLITENLLRIEEAGAGITSPYYRLSKIASDVLWQRGTGSTMDKRGRPGIAYHGDKWGGKYLRSPDFFLEWLDGDKVKGLVRFADKGMSQDLVDITGYVHDNNTGGDFPETLFIRTIREANKIRLSKRDCYMYGVSESGSNRDTAPVLVPRTFGEKHLILYNSADAVGKEFYRLNSSRIEGLHLSLFLNSSLAIMQRELWGLVGLGGGALKFGIRDLTFFLWPECLQFSKIDTQRLAGFLDREVTTVFAEMGIDSESDVPIEEQEPSPLPDRKALDDIVFDALNLTVDERKEVYRAVCRLVHNRISRANSV